MPKLLFAAAILYAISLLAFLVSSSVKFLELLYPGIWLVGVEVWAYILATQEYAFILLIVLGGTFGISKVRSPAFRLEWVLPSSIAVLPLAFGAYMFPRLADSSFLQETVYFSAVYTCFGLSLMLLVVGALNSYLREMGVKLSVLATVLGPVILMFSGLFHISGLRALGLAGAPKEYVDYAAVYERTWFVTSISSFVFLVILAVMSFRQLFSLMQHRRHQERALEDTFS
ncbi:MAG: hypothetical protein AAGG45_09795 [Pseudomonadota bacterium]